MYGFRIRFTNDIKLTSKKYNSYHIGLKIDHDSTHALTVEKHSLIVPYFCQLKEDFVFSRELSRFKDFKNHLD